MNILGQMKHHGKMKHNKYLLHIIINGTIRK